MGITPYNAETLLDDNFENAVFLWKNSPKKLCQHCPMGITPYNAETLLGDDFKNIFLDSCKDTCSIFRGFAVGFLLYLIAMSVSLRFLPPPVCDMFSNKSF